MPSSNEGVRYPNESPEYRASRDQLLQAEIVRRPDGIYHTYCTELLFAPSEPGQDGRHVDLIWPLWNLFDYTPEGRGTDWYPKLAYGPAE